MKEFKEFKGTKGEWIYEPTGLFGNDAEFNIITNKDWSEGKWICNINNADLIDGTIEEVEANAKLISAAPDLLQALQELYYLVSELPEEGSLIQALAKAKAAIEKAL